MNWNKNNFYRICEFFCFFFIAPALFAFKIIPVHVLVLLWVATLVAYGILVRQPRFSFRKLWKPRRFRVHLQPVLKRFFTFSLLITAFVLIFLPDRFLYLPRHNTEIWATILVVYPLLSVLPQGFVYRIFLRKRYRSIFVNDQNFVLVGALAFGFMHIIFRNWVAVGLTLIGGYLFLSTYIKSRSFLLSSLEHALYGLFVFSIGFDRFLFSELN